MNWTAEESALWLNEMVRQFQLEGVPPSLYLPGRHLCAMGQSDFSARAPVCGDTLHAQLQIWKTGTFCYLIYATFWCVFLFLITQ